MGWGYIGWFFPVDIIALHSSQCFDSYVTGRLLLDPFNGLFSKTTWVSRYQKGNASLDLNEARDDVVLWHQLDHMQTIFTLLPTDNHTNTSSVNFYRPDALPDHQPTVSKHWRPVTWSFSYSQGYHLEDPAQHWLTPLNRTGLLRTEG